VSPASLAGTIHPSEEDLQGFFKSAPTKYTIPAKREYTVVYADQDKIGATLTIGEEMLRAEYNRQLVTSRAQQRYDDLTDHSRNDVAVKDAVDQAIKETN